MQHLPHNNFQSMNNNYSPLNTITPPLQPQSSLLGHISHNDKLLPDMYYSMKIDDPAILNMLNNIPSDANPKPMLCVIQMKELQRQTKPNTVMKPSNNPNNAHMPTYICTYKYSDEDNFIAEREGTTKKKAEHSAAQMILAYLFPDNWS